MPSKNSGEINFLDLINGPDDLKKLRRNQLVKLAAEIRKLILEVVSKHGGHLASSLGVVELTIALHYVFGLPTDKIVWDVGHQCYAHKILTGRRDQFPTLRQQGGISGFPKRSESIYDSFDTGHSATSISAVIGFAEALRKTNQEGKMIAVIGDGSLTSGLAWEALNQLESLKSDLIVVLNDNEMSISKNVGGLPNYLNKIITGHFYQRVKDNMEAFLKSVPSIGSSMFKVARKFEEILKSLIIPGLLFEELGLNYIGPINGHDLDQLIGTFTKIKSIRGPVLVHVATEKGKGYIPAEKNRPAFHSAPKFDINTGEPLPNKIGTSYTEAFSKALIKLAEQDKRIIAITAAMPEGTGLLEFAQKFPDRFYDVGIAEQHAVTFAAGLAATGCRPVAAIYSTFLQRAYDQILHDVCLQDLPVTFCLDRAGIVGPDGPTHQGLFDLSYLRPLPNMILMAPKDLYELGCMLKTALEVNHPAAIRYPKAIEPKSENYREFQTLQIGCAELLREGSEMVLLAIGSMVKPAFEAARLLTQRGIEAAVINARFVKPLDSSLILEWAEHVPYIVTIEENSIQGGFGSAVLELLQSENKHDIWVKCLGIPDQIIEHGIRENILDRFFLSPEGIAETALDLIRIPAPYVSKEKS